MTLAPRAMNFFTVSGVAATRRSPGSLSFRTAIFIPRPLPASVADDQNDENCRQRREDRPIFHQADEEIIGAPVRPVRALHFVHSHRYPSLFGHSLTKAARPGARAPSPRSRAFARLCD